MKMTNLNLNLNCKPGFMFIFTQQMTTAVLPRWGPETVVRVLFEETQLNDTAVLGAISILDLAGVQLTMPYVVAAAFLSYKNHGTSTDDRISYFRSQIVPLLPVDDDFDFKDYELRLLKAIGWGMPSRTRLDDALIFAHGLGVPQSKSLEALLGRLAVLALLLPDCVAMTGPQHARVVLCAAAIMKTPAGTLDNYMCGLPCAGVSREFIVIWAVRIVLLAQSRIGTETKEAPGSAQGTKRPREESFVGT